MADPTSTTEIPENETTDPQAYYLAQQEANIQRLKDAGNEDSVRYLEVLRGNADKAVYRDADTGAKVIMLDGDSESIKPYTEMTHSRALEHEGGLEQLIEAVRENSQKAVDAGTLTQAAMDKRLEIMTEAGTDSAKYAELRFANNEFFAEQAGIAGQDVDSVNDVTLIENVPEIISTTTVTNEDGTTSEPETEVIREASNLTSDDVDMNTLVKVADGNQLTAAGNLYVMSDMMSEVMGRPMGIDPVGVLKDKFDELLTEHGSVEALATHLEQNMAELTGDQAISPDMQAGILEAVRNSEGDSARFAATVMNDVMLPPPPVNPGANVDPAAEVVEQEKRATDLQNLLGPGGLNFDLGGNEGLLNIVGMFIAIFTGQDPEKVIADLRQQNQPESGETPTAVASATDGTTPGGPGTTSTTGGTTTSPAGDTTRTSTNSRFEEPITRDDVELRAAEISNHTLKGSPEFMAVMDQIADIRSDLDAKVASGEMTSEEMSVAWEQQTKSLHEQVGAMATQVKNQAREAASNEMGVDFATMYPELVAPEGGPEVTADAGAGTTGNNTVVTNETSEDSTLEGTTVSNNTATEEVEVTDATNDETPTEEVAVVNAEDDKGYVRGPTDGAVTYAVNLPVNGEPVRSDEGALYQFPNGDDLSTGFGGAVNPTQVAMVDPFDPSDPFAEAFATLDQMDYDSSRDYNTIAMA